MSGDNDFYTKTMAKVYIDQGHLKKAAEIYQYLLKITPDKPDLVRALFDLEEQITENRQNNSAKLVNLFSQWIDLVHRYKQLQRLKKTLKRFKELNRWEVADGERCF
ncbi:MAG: hypothetical protein QF888_08895 [Desulfobacterales bacterium]|nr:hypothetical protein [Desulfobacterales bacterium]MDP7418096.1 hypothetical protein [Desulfobacterales bacterium]HJO61482.1 hypothetical protein [Desulfobacterales bacterium]